MIGTVLRWSAFLFGLTHVYVNVFGALSELWLSAIHFGGFGALCALSFHKGDEPRRASALRTAAAVGLALLSLSVPTYLILMEDALYARGSDFLASDYLFAGLAVVLAFEFSRRTTGWFMPILMAVSIAYILFLGRWVSGVFSFPGLNVETFLYRAYFGGDGMFGLIANISATYVFMFILFGAFLMKSGGAEFITAFARSVGRRMAGGAGVVAVVGSGMMGSIAGSAVANTASTGVITIPMMKRSGFSPRMAAGIEAAASTGGQLMPPVMGAGAFIMANYTQVSYLTVIAVSLLPALLYFLSVAYVVRIEARRLNLRPEDEPDGVAEGGLLKKGWPFLTAIAILVGFLVAGYTPIRAVFFAILAVIATSWLTKKPMTPRRCFDAVVDGVRMLLPTAILLVAVGIVVNVVTTTGLGNAFSLMIVEWSGGNLLIAIALIALASLILGMGLPVTASYIVLATLAAPILFDFLTRDAMLAALAEAELPQNVRATLELFGGDAARALNEMPLEMKQLLREELLSPEFLSATLLAAHLIIFWLSQDSNVTPPVCLTAFTAAGIAGTRPMSTGIAAWKAAKGLYIVPLLFAYSALVTGDWGERLRVFGWSAIGLYALAGVIQWHLEARLNAVTAGLLAASAVLLLWAPLAFWLHAVGALLLLGVVLWQRSEEKTRGANVQ